jgi:simple sugar transport system permease protein
VSHSETEAPGGRILSASAVVTKKSRSLLGDSPIVPPAATIVVMLLFFSLFVPHFGTVRTFSGIMNAAAINAVAVIGVTFLMISGEFDLSVGTELAMGGWVFGRHVVNGGSPVVGVALAILVTAGMGLFNGVLVTGTGLPSFIVTLGTRSIYRGAIWVYSGGFMLETTEKLPVFNLFTGRLDVINDLFSRSNFRATLLWAIGLAIVFQLILTRTRFGNHVFAVGGSPEAARSQAVNVRRVKLISFTVTGALAGFAGVLTFSQHTTMFVATGSGLELVAVAAAVVGGTRLTGGVGSVIGGLLGVFLISLLRSGVVLAGLPADNFEAIVGVSIIAAAYLNERMSHRIR